MPQLVRQYGLYFAHGELAQQRVIKHHTFRSAKTCEVGIGMGTAAAAVHHKKPFGGEAAAFHQMRHALLEGFVFQWLELVEQRGDEGGKNHHQQQVEPHPDGPGPGPPVGACLAHQPQDGCCNRQANGGPQQYRLAQVCKPQGRGHFVEAEAFLLHKCFVQRHRQIDQPADEHKSCQQRQLLPHAATQPVQQRLVQQIQPAKQGPAQQHGSAQGQLQQLQPGFGYRVIRRLLVSGQGDALGKWRRNGVAVPCHVAYLPRSEPQFEQHARTQRKGKQKCEQQGRGNCVGRGHVRRV